MMMMNINNAAGLPLLLLLLFCGLMPSQQLIMVVHAAWSSPLPQLPAPASSSSSSSGTRDVVLSLSSRREMMQQIITTTTTTTAAAAVVVTASLSVAPAYAAAATPSTSELERVRLGHARIQYLLDNWKSITEICGTNVMSDNERKQVIRTESGSKCQKTPLRVQEYMGYKSTQDPLYKIDKLLVKAGSTVVNPDDYEDYLDCVERYREKADQTALLAYTSSWGEANPNGSKEVIDDYLEQTKAQVVESEKLLRSILGYLKLEPITNYDGK